MCLAKIVSSIAIASIVVMAPIKAQAFSLVGSSSGSWNLPNNPSASTKLTSINGESNNRLSWGRTDNCGTCTSFNNYVQFDGLNFNVSNNPFKLGEISFRNGSVWDGAIGDFALSLSLFINNESEVFNIPFSVLNTSNLTGNPVLDGDKLRFVNLNQSQTFENNGAKYALNLLGFSVNYASEFNAPESAIATTGIYAQVSELESQKPKKVSEPGLIAGLLVVATYFAMTRKQHKQRNK